MEEMTIQQVFTKVRDHLLEQNEPAILFERPFGCAYRTPRGLKCAAGCLILDEYYQSLIEGSGVTAKLVEIILVKSGVPRMALDLVVGLQRIHDVTPPREWEKNLRSLAIKHGLEWEGLR